MAGSVPVVVSVATTDGGPRGAGSPPEDRVPAAGDVVEQPLHVRCRQDLVVGVEAQVAVQISLGGSPCRAGPQAVTGGSADHGKVIHCAVRFHT